MQFWAILLSSLLLPQLTLWGASIQVVEDTKYSPLFTINPTNSLYITNSSSQAFWIRSIAGVTSNQVGTSGHVATWIQRGLYKNKIFMFICQDMTNFVWYPEGEIFLGANDVLRIDNWTTNILFVSPSYRKDFP